MAPRRLALALPCRGDARLRRPQPVHLPVLLALGPAAADKPVGLEVDADEAAGAAPPGAEDARRPPRVVGPDAAPQQVLLVGDAQVVAEMVLPGEGLDVALAPLVVARVLGPVLRDGVPGHEVPVQVRLPARLLAAPGIGAFEAAFVLW